MISDDFAFIDMLTSYQPAALITAATRLGVFNAIAAGPATAADVATALDTDPATTAAMLESLHRIGLAGREGDCYTATEYSARRLAGDGEMRLVVAKEEVFADAWQHLADTARSGRPVMEAWRSRVHTNPSQARSFLEALDVLARVSGPPLAELDVLAPGKLVLDVGGGLGSYAARLAAAGSRVILVDLPEVIDWAADTRGENGVELLAADVMAEEACGVAPGSVDTALVSHMLHDLPPAGCADLLRRVHAAVRPGGHVVVNDFAGDSGPGAFGPLFDLMMRVETGGSAHALATLHAMLEDAGFVEVKQVPYPEPLTVLIGEKQWPAAR